MRVRDAAGERKSPGRRIAVARLRRRTNGRRKIVLTTSATHRTPTDERARRRRRAALLARRKMIAFGAGRELRTIRADTRQERRWRRAIWKFRRFKSDRRHCRPIALDCYMPASGKLFRNSTRAGRRRRRGVGAAAFPRQPLSTTYRESMARSSSSIGTAHRNFHSRASTSCAQAALPQDQFATSSAKNRAPRSTAQRPPQPAPT